MMHHPPQQLSLNFDDEIELRSPETSLLDCRDAASETSHEAPLQAPVKKPQHATVLSLCGAREAREQKRISDIYRSILDSVSHIA